MAGTVLPQEIVDLLTTLELQNYYPERLTRDDLYQITRESILDRTDRNCPVPWRFIYNITRYNYQARNVQTQETSTVDMSKMGLRERLTKQLDNKRTAVHPLDLTVSVFLCCEPTARQDLVMHLWGCKLAIPFVIPTLQTDVLTAYLWPLRCLVAQGDGKEIPLIDMSVKTISFIRIGENENLSKSFLLNSFIGESEKAHPMFFHRDSDGSKKSRSCLSNGLIELGWFLPKGSSTDKFSSPRLFLNLRGDAKDLLKQVQLIGEMSTVTIVVCTVKYLQVSKAILRSLLEKGSSLVVLLTDKQPDMTEVETFLEYFPETKYPDEVLDIILVESSRLWDILISLQHNVDKMEKNNHKAKALKDISVTEAIFTDEKEKHYESALHHAEIVISHLKKESVEVRKRVFFPLQETFWKDWSKLDRDLHRFEQLEAGEKSKYGSRKEIEEKLKNIRKGQFKLIRTHGISNPMHYFLYVLLYFDDKSRQLFLRYLKLSLDNLSRKHMVPFYQKYHELVVKHEEANEEDRLKINEDLSKLDIQKTNISLGLEHFIREMGQIFEACESCSQKNVILIKTEGFEIYHNQLPEAACISLFDGYSLEILDGEACSVPILWVKCILDIIPQVMTTPPNECLRIHVISVLGVQSSGKSTFLNTLFGLQFAVSAGRCTRGAFMQLVKIGNDLKNVLKTDYVLAIDTEGLKSVELTSHEFVKHDNELSTFAIGLADTTAINLMGENATYLQDNLPIAVHAFLRMNLVGLHPRCIIVHHNVDKRNKEKLLQQGHFLETVLNKHTQKACEIEKIPDKLFKEIIEFNISEHTDYVPALFEGEQPMAPVSTGYSNETDMVRAKLVRFVESYSDLNTLSQFTHHLENLWTAIKRDRFVYEFKTTLETEARIHLDNGYCKILNGYLRELESINTDLKRSINKRKNLLYYKEKYSSLVKSVEKKHFKKMKNFFEEPKKVRTDRLECWQKKYMKTFEDVVERNKTSDLQNIENYYASLEGRQISIDQYKHWFSIYSKNKDLHPDNENSAFEKTWKEWTIAINIEKNDVLSDTKAALPTVCPAHIYLLEESDLRQRSLKTFKISVSRHLNYPLERSSPDYMLSKMEDIRQTAIRAYDAELNGIRDRQLPYSNRNPTMILLTIKKHLQHRLDTEDKHAEIRNMFLIDMLLCTAGSCVADLEKRNKEDEQLLSIRAELKELAISGDKVIKNVSAELKEVLCNVIARSILVQRKEILRRSLYTSKWHSVVRTKETLLGNCLKDFVRSKDDKLLLLYVNYPVSAVTEYLHNILLNVINSKQFLDECGFIVTSEVEKLSKLVKEFVGSKNKEFVTPKELILYIVSKIELSATARNLISYRVNNHAKFSQQHILFEIELAKDLLAYSKQLKIEALRSQIILKGTLNVLARDLCTVLIGCQKQCPLCRELCRYSSRHPGEHECYIHRPIGCAGNQWYKTRKLSYETCTQHVLKNNRFWNNNQFVQFSNFSKVYPDWKLAPQHRSEQSLVWKLIFVKKHSVLKTKLELPETLPETWKSIEEFEVLRAIDSQFKLKETSV